MIDEQEFSRLKARQGWSPDEIKAAYESRNRCSLTPCGLYGDPDTGFVKVRSRGSEEPQIVIVGEAPGYDESKCGEAFVGRAARFGEGILKSLKIPLEMVRFTNTTRCFPHDAKMSPRPPKFAEETVWCLPFLWAEIDAWKPKVIVTLGKTATYAVLGKEGDLPITKIAGETFHVEIRGHRYPVVPCPHFSAELRQPGMFQSQIKASLRNAYDIVVNKKVPVTTHVLNSTGEAMGFLQDLLDRHRAGDLPYVAFDLEYDVLVGQDDISRSEANRLSSLDLYNPEKKLVAASYAYADNEGYCIPLDHVDSKVDYDAVLPLVREVANTIPIICHNYLKAEGAWMLQKAKARTKLFADTMLMSFVLRMKTTSHGLKGLCMEEFEWPDWSAGLGEQLAKLPPDQRSYKNLPLDVLGKYAAIDPVGCWALYKLYLPQIQMLGLEAPNNLLREASEKFLDLESRGAFLDMDLLAKIDQQYDARLAECRGRLREFDAVKTLEDEIADTFNPNSPYQLADVLFGKYKQPILHTTDEEDDAFVEQRWTDLRKGDTELPFQVPEDFLGKSIWLGKKDGGKIGERVRIKEIAHDATLLAEPLKNDFLKPVEVIYGAPSTAEQTVIELLKSYRCKTCWSATFEGDPQFCETCKGSRIDDRYKEVNDFLWAYRQFKKTNKAITAYVKSLPRYLVPETNRLVYNYVLHGTDTGRLASRDASLMTLPSGSDIRRLFVSKWKEHGGLIMSIDQSQLEMRVLASYCQDRKFMEIFLTCTHCGHVGTLDDHGTCVKCDGQLGDDMHTIVATQAFQKPRDQITKAMRRFAKTIGFGVVYGISAQSIAESTGMSDAEAQTLIDNFYKGFPTLRKWMDSQVAVYKKHGWVMGANGRRLFMDGYKQPNPMKHIISKAERQAVNFPIQSAASDLTLHGMLISMDVLKEKKLKSRAWEFTHDSIEYDVYPGEFMDVLRVAKNCLEIRALERCPWMKAPLLAEAEIGVRWDGALAIKEITDQHLLLEGRKVYFEETMAVFEKLYPGVTAEVLEEKMDPVEDDLMPRQAYKGEIDPVVVKVKVMGLG